MHVCGCALAGGKVFVYVGGACVLHEYEQRLMMKIEFSYQHRDKWRRDSISRRIQMIVGI